MIFKGFSARYLSIFFLNIILFCKRRNLKNAVKKPLFPNE